MTDSSTIKGWGVVIAIIVAIAIFGGGDSATNTPGTYSGSSYNDEDETIDRYDAISYHWEEIREYLNSTETVNVCSSESGNCYDLDVDIYDGQVDTMYFPNGGYLSIGAYIDENGYASGLDREGRAWDFSIDLDSSFVDDAIYEWASDNGYELE